ncbi:Aspartic protease [Phytophthora palmivora]|uniref:Aspartic protease n=1 Tax=Phytophthora palmivora TaxID=4796 RepID=A0A2P4XVD6_9STRA|nr:Aspartic protease [Phytophthora palmivora]
MVHGAVNDCVNNCRTNVLLDTGATVNIVSFDLARKLGLHLKSHKQTKVSGMGGVPTYIGASAQVKITLGSRMVYLLDVWVANIGEGIEVLLGMSFMFAAGVRIGVREGLVMLSDEETIVMCGWNPEERSGVDMPVETTNSWYLAPGESKVVKISYGLTNPQREVVWAGRGDRWVVNISDKDVWINNRTPVARIVEYGFFPRAGRFVRPGSFAYREWQILILENVQSREGRIRAERLAALEPPCVDTPKYPWPTTILSRPAKGPDIALLASILRKPKIRRVRFAEDASTQTDEVSPESFRESRDMAVDTNDLGNNSLTDEVSSTASHPAETPTLGVEIDGDFQGWRGEEGDSLDSVADDDDSLDAVEDYWDIPISGMPGTPLEKLKQEYERCMRLSTEDLDYEPAVYMREGSELLSQLRDQLVMLPEMKDLTPECKIEEADVGVPGKTTPEMEGQVRRILEYHRKIFLGDGNAAPPPARGVVCDLDVGDAKPVAQRPRSIAPHLWTKVYELLKKLLENGLIETSTSPWASPIVIVLKKNGVDIRMCIDYRVVNGFIKLSHYPLPLIDDLLIGFESAMWFMSLDMASGFWAIKMTERAKLISAFVCPYGHYQWVRMPFGLKKRELS